jgi:hypothetical protein
VTAFNCRTSSFLETGKAFDFCYCFQSFIHPRVSFRCPKSNWDSIGDTHWHFHSFLCRSCQFVSMDTAECFLVWTGSVRRVLGSIRCSNAFVFAFAVFPCLSRNCN